MRTHALSFARPAALALASLTAAACGGEPPPPPAAPTAAVEAPPPPAATATAAPASNAAAEACIAAANASRARFSGEPAKIKVKHILVMYKGGKRSSEGLTRTREEACLRAIEARDKLRGGADFGEAVKQYSDEPGAATREGMIGEVERKMLVKPFADAAFELSINQLSDVVETEFGFHVIFRTQ